MSLTRPTPVSRQELQDFYSEVYPDIAESQQEFQEFYEDAFSNITASQQELQSFFNGTIPYIGGNQVEEMPETNADNLGEVVQYIGTTDASYTNGYFYKCVSDGQATPTYSWTRINVQPGGSGGGASSLSELDDTAISNPSNNQVLKYNATTGKWVNGAGGGSSATVLTQTLAAGSTSVTFTGIPTTGDNLIDFFTSNGINYTAIDTSTAGQVTLTYESQSSAVTVYCRIETV